jgi:CRP/FNR family transcriptional regulator, anaerobic regulatory protein
MQEKPQHSGEWSNLFPYLSQPETKADARIAGAIQEISLPADTIAFRQGDNCTNYLLVIEGSIKVLARGESGREIVLYRVQRGGSCILTTSCLLSHGHYPAEGVTETPVRALAIPAATFHQGLAESGAFRQFVFNTYGQRLAEVIALVENISFGQLKQRLARYLINHCRDTGTLKTTHHNLATELGSAREVISRQLKEFERHGWITQHRGQITVQDRAQLEQLAGSRPV